MKLSNHTLKALIARADRAGHSGALLHIEPQMTPTPQDLASPIDPTKRIWPKMGPGDQWHPPLTPPPNLKLGPGDQYRYPLTPPAECFQPDSDFPGDK